MISRKSTGEHVAHRAHVRLNRTLPAVFLAVAFLLAPRSAAAVTVDQIVALSKAGVSEAVILALLDRDPTVLTLDPEQLVTLKREGLSDNLILAMLRNGREEAEEAARAVSEEKAASILATLPLSSSLPAPDFVVVGHGPERPNANYSSTGFRNAYVRGSTYPPGIPPAPYIPALPYNQAYPYGALPYGTGLPYGARVGRPAGGYGYGYGYRTSTSNSGDRVLCLAQTNTPQGPGPSYVTECPAVMQPRVR